MDRYTAYGVVEQCRFNKSIEWCRGSDVEKLEEALIEIADKYGGQVRHDINNLLESLDQ